MMNESAKIIAIAFSGNTLRIKAVCPTSLNNAKRKQQRGQDFANPFRPEQDYFVL